ncbi:MAG: tetratricopeptide repeat protein [Ignavibacteriales bacterium]|nr:tetratricopeptide repeat protein [Ignavibacteriales bacterium]
MKKHTIFIMLSALVTLFFILTGFQCSSQEMTSARLYIQRQDWENAEKWLTAETEKNPTNAEAWYLLGNAKMQRGDFQNSMIAYDNCAKNSNEFNDKITMSKRYIWGQSLNAGVNWFNKSISAPPESASTFRQRAIGNYKTALIVNSDSVITYQNLAVAQHAENLYDDEIATLQEGLKRKVTTSMQISLIDAYLIKAQDADAKGEKEKVSTEYTNAIDAIIEARKNDPENAQLLSTMIDLHVRIGKANEAKPYIREAIAKDPENKIYQYNLGVLLMQTDSLEEAITHFEAALQADPNYDVALQNIGVAYLRLGDKLKQATQGGDAKKKEDKTYLEKFKKAVGYLEKLTELKKEDAGVWDLMASAYANANMLKEAKAAIEKADALRKK